MRTRRFHHESQLPRSSELLDIDPLCPHDNLRIDEQQRDSHFKAAQKGPECAKEHLASFFEATSEWKTTSATLLVDLTPNAGDMPRGYFDFQQGLGRSHNMGSFYYVGIGSGSAKSAAVVGARFAEKRIRETVAMEWLKADCL